MEAIMLVSSIIGLGYLLKESREDIRNVEINDSINSMPEREKPNSLNIYSSNKVEAINNELLQMSIDNYRKAEEPALTGVLPPIYNAYSSINNTNVGDEVNLRQLSMINNVNKLNVVNSVNPPELTARPMFNNSLNLGSYSGDMNYTNFGMGEYNYDTEESLLNRSVIQRERSQQVPFNTSNVKSVESYENSQPVSLLSGLPLHSDHNNMVPFFGSNVKQNMDVGVNASLLDKYTGNVSTFKHKKEVEPFFENVIQNVDGIEGTPMVTDKIDKDRFIPSYFRQGEKPFYAEQVAAPIAGIVENPITTAQTKQPTIDSLRVANKAQVSYEGRTISGQMGNIRGYQAVVNKNQPDTHYDMNPDRYFTTVGAVTASKMTENYENMTNTARQDQNMEYYGIANSSDKNAFTQRVKSIDNSHELLDALAQEPKRQQLASDTLRNIGTSGIRQANDYGKSGYKLPQLQRDTTNQMHLLNANKSDSGHNIGLQDDVKNTGRETLANVDSSGQIKTAFDQGYSGAYAIGVTDVTAKTTQKEMLVHNKYKGNPNKKDAMGYNVVNMHAKTTNKEINAMDQRNASHANDTVKNHTVYETYMDPVKIRVPTHVKNYIGSANNHVSQEENRNRFLNAEISTIKEQAVMGERPAGHNGTLGFLNGGRGVVGETKLTDNMLLKSDDNKHLSVRDNLYQPTPNKELIGMFENLNTSVSAVESTRFNGSDIQQQLQENPYALRLNQ